MSSCATLILPKSPSLDSSQLLLTPHYQSLSSPYRKDMWGTIFRRVSRPYPSSSLSSVYIPISNFLEDGFFLRKGSTLDLRTPLNEGYNIFSQLGFCKQNEVPRVLLGNSSCPGILSVGSFKGFASVAEAVEAISSTDVDEETSPIEEIQGLLEEISSIEDSVDTSLGCLRKMPQRKQQKPQHLPRVIPGMGAGKYHILRRKQIKIETEAWSQAAQEYKELLMDMCEKKLAPNLPYMKSLFLGWFEPFRDQIVAEQELCKDPKCKASHARYFNELPADMMAVITMHKLMGLLMTASGDGSVRVVQASCQIGDAIEQEV